MKTGRCLRLKYVDIIFLFALEVSAVRSSRAACYSTPSKAVDALVTDSSISPGLEKDGYRVTRIESDPVLGQRWVMIARCDRPGWPGFAFPANGAKLRTPAQEPEKSILGSVGTVPVVRAGDVVRIWKQESLLRIEVTGVSEQSGGLGNTIRVRLLRRSTDDQSIPEQLSGVIRGASDVEMQP
jgi:hypothetical protein